MRNITSLMWLQSTPLPDLDVGTNSTQNEDIPELIAGVVKAIVLGSVIVITIVGNTLVLLAVFSNSHLRSTTNYFIVNLAIADLLLATLVLPFSASLEVSGSWEFGQTFCDIWAAVDVLCCTASIMSLCAISVDRYFGVTRPLQHSTILSEKRAVLIIIFVWILSLVISVAPLIGWKEQQNPNPKVCTVTQQLGYVLFSVSGSFYIPMFIILIVYFRIYREALNHSKFLSKGVKVSKINDDSEGVTLRIHVGKSPQPEPKAFQSSSSSDQSEDSNRKLNSRLTLAGKIARFNREKKAAKTLGIVVGVFILCWFPFFFVLPLGALCKECQAPEPVFKVIFWLGYCNSMINPIIYSCSSREFRRAFRRILKCQCKRSPRYFYSQTCISSSSAHDIEKDLSSTSPSPRPKHSTRLPSSKQPTVVFRSTRRCPRSTTELLSAERYTNYVGPALDSPPEHTKRSDNNKTLTPQQTKAKACNESVSHSRKSSTRSAKTHRRNGEVNFYGQSLKKRLSLPDVKTTVPANSGRTDTLCPNISKHVSYSSSIKI